MDAETLLRELAAQLRLPSLTLDAKSRTCRLLIGEELVVDVEAPSEGGAFFLHGVAGTLRAGDAATARKLLEANLFGAGTAGASLGVDPANDEVVLFLKLEPAATDFPAFQSALEGFIATLQSWRGRLAAGVAEVPAASPAPLQTYAIRG
jgi:hypothetical protein